MIVLRMSMVPFIHNIMVFAMAKSHLWRLGMTRFFIYWIPMLRLEYLNWNKLMVSHKFQTLITIHQLFGGIPLLFIMIIIYWMHIGQPHNMCIICRITSTIPKGIFSVIMIAITVVMLFMILLLQYLLLKMHSLIIRIGLSEYAMILMKPKGLDHNSISM